MQYISFCENVFLTNGAKKSTISDYNNLRLYHLTEDETAFISRVIGHYPDALSLTQSDLQQIEFLRKKKLITYSNFLNNGQIKKKYTTSIDFAWVEITSQCNLKCLHCYNESDSHCLQKMEISDFIHVADELAALGIGRIQFIGGEPLLLGLGLAQMIQYARPLFSSIEIFTNGTLLTDEWVDFFKEYQIKVALSVYSYDSAQHDKVTQVEGSHKQTVTSIQKLSNKGVKYRVANVLMKGIELSDKNTELYYLNPNKDVVRFSGRGNLGLISRELIKKRLITERSFSMPLSYNLFKRNMSGHNCFARRVYIASDLTVYPCVMERRISHGNLRTCSLRDILQENIIRLDKDHINGCKDCEFRYCCHDCRPDSLSEDLYAKPWYCTYNPYTGNWQDEEEFINDLEQKYSIKF